MFAAILRSFRCEQPHPFIDCKLSIVKSAPFVIFNV